MRNFFLPFALCVGFFVSFAAHAGQKDIFITNVFSNPEGSDTGFEYIVLKNTGSEAVSLDGWTLYPDGIGYYTFPSFSLPAGAGVTVRLRASGADSASTLYHSSAGGNMGNSSGSIALFASATRNETTIIDFMQYGRSGETWETSADEAGVWTKGEFVAVDAEQENYIFVRKEFRYGKSAWQSELKTSSDSGTQSGESEDVVEGGQKSGEAIYSGPTTKQSIRAYAGDDMSGVAGAVFAFSGTALGFDDDVLGGEHIRYLWNFGDGRLLEGKKVEHIYRYPGTYMAALTLVQGEESFSDYLKVVVRENPLVISGVDAGAGWVQISNPSAARIDISHWALFAGDSRLFYFPAGTLVAERAKAVFATTSFASISISLRYPNGEVAVTGLSSSVAPTPSATPAVARAPSIEHAPRKVEEPKRKEDIKESAGVFGESAPELLQSPEMNRPMTASLGQTGISPMRMLMWSIGGGIIAGALVFVTRGYWQRTITT